MAKHRKAQPAGRFSGRGSRSGGPKARHDRASPSDSSRTSSQERRESGRKDGARNHRGGQGSFPGKSARHERRGEQPAGAGSANMVQVIGRNPVKELLRHCPERVRRAFTSHPFSTTPGPGVDHETQLLLQEHGIEVRTATFPELTARCGTDGHQGWLLEAEPRPSTTVKEILTALSSLEMGVILMLDAIEDPQNLGSIIRAAECFGVEAVIWSKNRGASVTASAIKASAGATELVTLVEVSNLQDAIMKCRDSGWWILGATVSEEAIPVHEFDGPFKVVLIVGSEGKGLSELTVKRLDQKIMIPMRGRLDSLNVGQATAVMLAGLAAKISAAGSRLRSAE